MHAVRVGLPWIGLAHARPLPVQIAFEFSELAGLAKLWIPRLVVVLDRLNGKSVFIT